MSNLSRAEIFGITIFIILGMTWFGKVSFGFLPNPKDQNPSQKESLENQEPKTILIHVAGAVEKPGMMELPSGSRVADALKKAGGTVLNADTTPLNLAENLEDGDKLYIPFKGDSSTTEILTRDKSSDKSKKAGVTKPVKFPINLNTATMDELMQLPGIGDVRAKGIIDYRNRQGGFKKREEIMNVKGIGEGTYEKIKDLIYV